MNYVQFLQKLDYFSIDYKLVGRETIRDPILSKVFDAVQTGKFMVGNNEDFNPFKKRADELNVEQICILLLFLKN